jgi:hypothetical protein
MTTGYVYYLSADGTSGCVIGHGDAGVKAYFNGYVGTPLARQARVTYTLTYRSIFDSANPPNEFRLYTASGIQWDGVTFDEPASQRLRGEAISL